MNCSQKVSNMKMATEWYRITQQSLLKLKNSEDIGTEMLWLSDKLANIRSLARDYSETGERVWTHFHQQDPAMHCWYYRTVAEYTEMDLNRTGAYKELIKHINFIWPGTLDSDKTKYRKYRNISLDGCRLLGRGLKGDVYRYDDELILKVFNRNNTYKDVEREISLSRRAFVLGVPTAISFGIVSVGDRYGAMYEMVDADTITACISRNPSAIDYYAEIMANLARQIHGIEAEDEDHFPDAKERVREYILRGVEPDNPELAEKCLKLVDQMPTTHHLIHGDYHTSNAFMHKSEAVLIDMDRISMGDPVIELGDLYLYYAASSDSDPNAKDPYLGIPVSLCKKFYKSFLKHYVQTDDERIIQNISDQAKLLGNIRLMNRLRKAGSLSPEARKQMQGILLETSELVDQIGELGIGGLLFDQQCSGLGSGNVKGEN